MQTKSIFRFHLYTYRIFYIMLLLFLLGATAIGYIWLSSLLPLDTPSFLNNVRYFYITLITLLLFVHIGGSIYETVYVSKFYLQVHIQRKHYILSSLLHQSIFSIVSALILLLVGILFGAVFQDALLHTSFVSYFLPIAWFGILFSINILITLITSYFMHLKGWILVLVVIGLLGGFIYAELIQHIYINFLSFALEYSHSLYSILGIYLVLLAVVFLFVLRYRKIAIYYY